MSSLIRKSSSIVIKCFGRVEAFADWATGAAGPVFVAFCWILIISGGIAFFDVVVRDLSPIGLFLISPLLLFVPLNLYGQYYLVTHVPPGFPSPRAGGEDRDIRWLVPKPSSLWAGERWGFQRRNARALTSGSSSNGTYWGSGETARRVKRCRKCDGPKPERAHHCSVCKRCILLMDHHCPWINGCVGLHNQRHFVLFMAWLSVGCWTVCATGYRQFLDTFDYRAEWLAFTPRLAFTLIYVLSIAIGFAVPILAIWHMYMVSNGETSIESHDNTYLAGRARAEGLIYLNPYDLGRKRNLEIFFNIGSSGYSRKTLFFPFWIPPQSNGWSYPRRQLPTSSANPKSGLDLHVPELADGLISATATVSNAGHGSHAEDGQGGYVMGDDGSLTDDEEGGGGYMD